VSSRGKALGYVRHAPRSDKYIETAAELEARISVLLAGAMAEELILGERSTGASQDIQQAVETARKIVNCGLSDLGIISEEDIPRDQYHTAVTRLVQAQEERAKSLLVPNAEFIRKTAGELMSVEKMNGDTFRAELSQTA